MSDIINSFTKIFTGSQKSVAPAEVPVAEPVAEPAEVPVAEPVEVPVEPAENSKLHTTVITPRTTTIEKFRNRNADPTPPVPTTAPLARTLNTRSVPLEPQSGGRRMRSKSKNLRPSLFRKYKYKMARRSMTMRKRCKKCGRKTCRGCKGTRKGSRRSRR